MNLNIIIQKKKKEQLKKHLEEHELNEFEVKEILTNHNINKFLLPNTIKKII